MALRGKQPDDIEKRFKAVFYGAAGVGKTMASIQFPKPYLIDTEHGAENDQYTKLLKESGGVIFSTSDFDDLIKEIKSLLTEDHEYKTLIIDPLTGIYNDLLDKYASKVGTEYNKHYAGANKDIKHLLNLLLRLDMNVIITAHAKNEYGPNFALLGQTFDCYRKLDYLCDLVLEIKRRGKERVAVVKKTRIKSFEENDTFPFSFDEVAKRYDLSMLEKESTRQELATEEQLNQINHLIQLLKIEHEVVEKWLIKANAETLAEMTKDSLQKCIEHLLTKIKGE